MFAILKRHATFALTLVWCSRLLAFDSTGMMYRADPARTGEYPTAPLAAAPSLKWTNHLAFPDTSTPAISPTQVLIADSWQTVAIDRTTGLTNWVNTVTETATGSPAIVSGLNAVYILEAQFLIGYNVATGAINWEFVLVDGIRSQPVVVNDIVYFGGVNGIAYALDATSGAVIWMTDTGGDIAASVAVDGGQAFVANCHGTVMALDAATGATNWSVNLPFGVFRTPCTDGTRLFVPTIDSTVEALSVVDGSGVWTFPVPDVDISSVATDGTNIFFATLVGNLYAVNNVTGIQEWSQAIGATERVAPTIAGTYLYIGNSNGDMMAFDTATGAMQWSFATSGPVVSDAAVSDSEVYFVSGHDLYALQ